MRFWVRKRGWRVNLRALAEVQLLVWLPLSCLIVWLFLRTVVLVWQVIREPFDPDAPLVP